MARWWMYSCALVSVLFLQGGISSYTKENVAPNKTAYQSSYYNTDMFNARYAVDGITACNGSQSEWQFICTDIDKPFTWWEVDLEQDYFIESVKIYFMSDHINRRRGIQLYTSKISNSSNTGHLCGVVTIGNQSNVINDTLILACNEIGRFVTLYQGTDNRRPDDTSKIDTVMHFCEVEVYARVCDPGFYGTLCVKECDKRNCKGNSSCDHIGTCFDGCKLGWNRADCMGDIDECSMNRTGCDVHATCLNTIGSVICTCNVGYIGDGRQCTDVNECQTNKHTCDVNANCHNTQGSFQCSCQTGYRGDGQTCSDIDECAMNRTGCDVHATCINTIGSVICTCNVGYIGDGRQCTDVNECQTNKQICDVNANCHNTQGSFQCYCHTGYRGDGQTCSDIDECITNVINRDDDADCNNIEDGYSGFGEPSTDDDDCFVSSDVCDIDAHCNNIQGSFLCTCRTGYHGDGQTCTDVNECISNNICDANAKCHNLPGSFKCSCIDGYIGNGQTCTDIEKKCAEIRLYGETSQEPDLNLNCSFNDIADSAVSAQLRNLSKTDITESNVADIVKTAQRFTENETSLNEKDLVYSADVIQKASKLTVLSSEVAKQILDVANNVMKKEKETLQKSETLGQAASRIIETLDSIGNAVVIPTNGTLRLVSDGYGTTVWDLKQYETNPVTGLQLKASSSDSKLTNENLVNVFSGDNSVFQETEAAIVIPDSFMKNAIKEHSSSDIRLMLHVFKDTKLFEIAENSSRRSGSYVLNSKVIAAKMTVNKTTITKMIDLRIKTIFLPNEKLKEDERDRSTFCGFWDFSKDGGLGGWSVEGCTHKEVKNGKDVCICDHLSNFAVLLDFSGQSQSPESHQHTFSDIEKKCAEIRLYGKTSQEPDLNLNCSFNDIADSAVSPQLRNLSMTNITESNVVDIVKTAQRFTENETSLNEKDLVYSADVIQKASKLTVLSSEVAKQILDVANNVMKKEKETLQKSETLGQAPSRIIETLDSIGNAVVIPTNGTLRLVSDGYGTTVWDLKQYETNPVTGLQLKASSSDSKLTNENLVNMFSGDNSVFQDTEAAIVIPDSFMKNAIKEHNSSDIRLMLHVFKDTKLFEIAENSSRRSGSYALNSKVIAAKITVNKTTITKMIDLRIKTIFLPNEKLKEDKRDKSTFCGFWNFSKDGGLGGWSVEGCTHKEVKNGKDVCICDHLTNFAVLLDFSGQSPESHQLALSIISIIGLSLSIAGLSLTVLTFIVFKKLRQTRPQQTLFNLALSQLCAWTVFLAGINETQHHAGCIAVAVLLHYFIIASFLWMLVEAVLHYLLFVKVVGSHVSHYVTKAAVVAWGLPILPIVIVLAIDYNLYRGGDLYCWMSLVPFYYAFALPIGLIILANLTLYILVVVSICRRSNLSGKSSQSNSQRHMVSIRASVFCFILLGLSWIFGYLAISDARVTFQYIFTITNTIQGFLIFILFTARDKRVRESWKSLFCPKKPSTSSTGKPMESIALTASTTASSSTHDSKTN